MSKYRIVEEKKAFFVEELCWTIAGIIPFPHWDRKSDILDHYYLEFGSISDAEAYIDRISKPIPLFSWKPDGKIVKTVKK